MIINEEIQRPFWKDECDGPNYTKGYPALRLTAFGSLKRFLAARKPSKIGKNTLPGFRIRGLVVRRKHIFQNLRIFD